MLRHPRKSNKMAQGAYFHLIYILTMLQRLSVMYQLFVVSHRLKRASLSESNCPECKVLLSFSGHIYRVCCISRLVSPRAAEWRGGAALRCTVQLLTSD